MCSRTRLLAIGSWQQVLRSASRWQIVGHANCDQLDRWTKGLWLSAALAKKLCHCDIQKRHCINRWAVLTVLWVGLFLANPRRNNNGKATRVRFRRDVRDCGLVIGVVKKVLGKF